MISPAAEAWTIAEGEALVFVLVAGGGPIGSDMSGAAPLLRHASLRGRFLLPPPSEVLEILRAATSAEGAASELRALGYDVKEARVESLRWALKGI